MLGMQPFEKNLGKLLQDLSLDQEGFAALVGVSNAAVSRWLSGKADPSFKWVIAIAAKTGASVDSLLGVQSDERAYIEAKIREHGEAKVARVLLDAFPRSRTLLKAGGVVNLTDSEVRTHGKAKRAKPNGLPSGRE